MFDMPQGAWAGESRPFFMFTKDLTRRRGGAKRIGKNLTRRRGGTKNTKETELFSKAISV